MADFKTSFDKWWNATKDVTSEAGKAVTDGIDKLGKDLSYNAADEEKVKIIMELKGVDEPAARKILAEFKAKKEAETPGNIIQNQLK